MPGDSSAKFLIKNGKANLPILTFARASRGMESKGEWVRGVTRSKSRETQGLGEIFLIISVL